jgi:ABC-type transport system substrate-binding protein
VYSLKTSYIEWSKQISDTSLIIKKELENAWIKIELYPSKLLDITKKIRNNTEEYDILIAWINLWYFNFNLSKYFYSGQITKWRNLSKIKNSELDNILEDLKSWFLSKDKRVKLQKAVVKILSKEAVFKPLYSPYYSNLVIKNIEWYELNEIIPSGIYRFEPLSKSYILKNKIINSNDKNLKWFLKFLFTNLF